MGGAKNLLVGVFYGGLIEVPPSHHFFGHFLGCWYVLYFLGAKGIHKSIMNLYMLLQGFKVVLSSHIGTRYQLLSNQYYQSTHCSLKLLTLRCVDSSTLIVLEDNSVSPETTASFSSLLVLSKDLGGRQLLQFYKDLEASPFHAARYHGECFSGFADPRSQAEMVLLLLLWTVFQFFVVWTDEVNVLKALEKVIGFSLVNVPFNQLDDFRMTVSPVSTCFSGVLPPY